MKLIVNSINNVKLVLSLLSISFFLNSFAMATSPGHSHGHDSNTANSGSASPGTITSSSSNELQFSLNGDMQLDRKENTPVIVLQNMKSLVGKYLTVIYGFYVPRVILIDPRNTSMRTIKSQQEFLISDDKIKVPSVTLEKESVLKSYNMVLLVISDQKGFSWHNSEGNPIIGGNPSSNHTMSHLLTLTRAELNDLVQSSGTPNVAKIDGGATLRAVEVLDAENKNED